MVQLAAAMQTPCSQQRQQPPTRLRVRMAMAPAALRPAHPWHQDAPKLVQRRFRATPAAAGAAGGEPRDAAGRQPAPTRLQQQLEQLVALDVECAHFKVPGQPRVVHLPAEVCVVDAHGEVLLHTHCNPRECVLCALCRHSCAPGARLLGSQRAPAGMRV